MQKLAADKIGVVDTRHHSLVHQGTVQGALNIPASGKAASFGAWAVDPETDDCPLILLAEDQDAARGMWDQLVRVGIDAVAGCITTLDGLPPALPRTLAPSDLENVTPALLLDARNATEHRAGHVPRPAQLNAGRVLWNLESLPREGAIVSPCQTGVRNSVAASALRRAGLDVVELEGSCAGWAQWLWLWLWAQAARPRGQKFVGFPGDSVRKSRSVHYRPKDQLRQMIHPSTACSFGARITRYLQGK